MPYPISSFDSTTEDKPDGFLGFTWPASNFFDESTGLYAGSWSLLGKVVELPSSRLDIPVCSSSGEFEGCQEFDLQQVYSLYEQAKSTVMRISKEIVKAKRRGWAPKGDLRKPYFRLMASLLKRIRDITDVPAGSYTCASAAPSSCTTVYISKVSLLLEFDRIFKVKLPKRLRYIYKLAPRERRKYIDRLKGLPTEYVFCPNTTSVKKR